MRITVPIYVQQKRDRGTAAPFTARPLMHMFPEKSGSDLGRVIADLTEKLRVRLSELARQTNQQSLLQWHHVDACHSELVKLNLDLRDSTAKLRILLVSIKQKDKRRFVFSPSLPSIWFDVRGDEDLTIRAHEVYEEHFRALRKENKKCDVTGFGITGKAWIDYVTIEVLSRIRTKKEIDPLRAILGGEEVSDGAEQLRKTGRCLNSIDIDQLAHPIGVEEDVRRLDQLLKVGDRRGVVLIGPAGSGKTARIEGAIRLRRRRQKSAIYGQVWNLSPQRLISGMSYLGQWQERVLSIFRHAHRHDHVLYFDDLLGLFEAGKTRDSTMCVADTLRAQLDVYPFRVLAEMTPQAWNIFRERDRTLADRFVVMPTEALNADQSLEIMIGVQRRLEAAHRCRFELDVIPETLSMYDRFERSTVLPGKAVAAMQRLASRRRGSTITREDAVAEFQSRSGLEPAIIDRRIEIDRELVTARIREQVVGQDEPVKKMVDRILVAAARMNDTSRPIGTFLLVGPTGVGKTQLSKAVASCLFDDKGLIRLDMNELSSPASAARLVGTFDSPDGLLTSAVRRRPNAVLLLDEIEKAHPSVLDVLLQALGEARLSDARGRTVDLSGLLILMTSNLGSRDSSRGRGFLGVDDKTIDEVHTRAARDFFRPEFFNRIDDVLSFQRLSPDVMQSIALMQFKDVLRRDGLQRRSVLIDVDPNAIRQTAHRGYDPAMGARALKRQIEQDLVRPAAEILAASRTDQPTLLRLYLDGKDVRTKWVSIEYEEPPKSNQTPTIDWLCEKAELWLDSIAPEFDGAPLSFEIGSDGVDVGTLETMTLRESLQQCRDTLRNLVDAKNIPKLQRPQATPVTAPRQSFSYEPRNRLGIQDLQAIDDIEDYLKDSLIEIKQEDFDEQRNQLIDQLCKLDQQLKARGEPTNWLIWLRRFGDELDPGKDSPVNRTFPLFIKEAFSTWAETTEELMVRVIDKSLISVSGALAAASVRELQGGWLFVWDGRLAMVDVCVRSLAADDDPDEVMKEWKAEIINEPISPIRRILHRNSPLIDLRTGKAVNQKLDLRAISKLIGLARRSISFLSDAEEPSS